MRRFSIYVFSLPFSMLSEYFITFNAIKIIHLATRSHLLLLGFTDNLHKMKHPTSVIMNAPPFR